MKLASKSKIYILRQIMGVAFALTSIILPLIAYPEEHPCTELAIPLLRFNEQSGKPPILFAYEDHKGIATIGTGFNLERDDANEIMALIAPDTDFDKLLMGETALTSEQAIALEKYIIKEAIDQIVYKIGRKHFEKLSNHQQVALISLAVHSPSLIGPNLVRHIRNNKFNMVEYEIRYRSNAKKHKGIQARREREADVFKTISALYDDRFRLDNSSEQRREFS